MHDKLKVEGHEGLFRDPNTGVIVNENNLEFRTFQERREAFRRNRQKLETQEEEITNLKSEISEIKQMLLMLLDKGKQ
ncbi:hypothetical protein [Synechococcus phage BUCT-ZZ01]|nr:hypothetical protein [Synechococcus phage BUCT-ZZ01]